MSQTGHAFRETVKNSLHCQNITVFYFVRYCHNFTFIYFFFFDISRSESEKCVSELIPVYT